jgi:hypothetical protein
MLIQSGLPWAGGALDLFGIGFLAVSQMRVRYAAALLACSADDILYRDLHLQPLLACLKPPLLPLLFAQ